MQKQYSLAYVEFCENYLALTRQVGYGLELLLPELGDGDGRSPILVRVGCHTLIVGVDHDLLKVVWVDRIEHVEKVLPGRTLVLGKRGWKVLHELLVTLELWEELPDAHFVVVRDSDLLDVDLLEQLLLAAEHILQEVLVHGGLIGEVVLQMSKEGLVRLKMATYLSR